MRWFVEVAEGSHDAVERWVVEAAHWQPALKEARSLRGEAGETSGFSVELLEDGFRAIDPSTLVRYVMRRAPEETPLSKPKPAASNGAAGHAPLEESLSPTTDERTPVVALDRKASPPIVDRPTPVMMPVQAAALTRALEQAVPLKVPAAPIPAITHSKPSSIVPPPKGSEPLPSAELLYEREEDASAASPITYRESAWLVPEGTSFEAAARLLMGTFEGMRAALAGVKAGKLVNMAVFDHRFEGKPLRPPVVTLSWKDWQDRGQGPELRRPSDRSSMNPGAPRSVPPSSMPAPASFAPPPVSVAAPAPVALAPVAVPVPTPVAVVELQPAAVSQPPPPAAAPVAQPEPAAQVEPATQAVPAPVAAPAEPVARPSSTPAPRRRLGGEELIADLFEAMHDLHFLRDPLEGADFVLSLAMDMLPSHVGLVHFYDIDAREFVVVRAAGPGSQKLRGSRTSEKEPVVAEAMRKRRAVVIADTDADGSAMGSRWSQLETPPRSLVCAPVELAGRFLGLLELCNPRDEVAFAEGDGHALTYIGEQFAEFLGSRTIVLDRRFATS